jgi:hypothetical protein
VEIIQFPMRSRKSFAANGIKELPESGSLLLKLANFSEKAILLRKGSVAAVATNVQSVMLIGSNEADSNSANGRWTDQLEIDTELSLERRKLAMKILESHENLWSGNRFGEIVGVEHRIITQG